LARFASASASPCAAAALNPPARIPANHPAHQQRLAAQPPAFSACGKKSRRLARVNALAEKLRFLPHLSEDERVLHACLTATPGRHRAI